MGGRYKPFGWISKAEKRRRAAENELHQDIRNQLHEEDAATHAMMIDPEHGVNDPNILYTEQLDAEREATTPKATNKPRPRRPLTVQEGHTHATPTAAAQPSLPLFDPDTGFVNRSELYQQQLEAERAERKKGQREGPG